MGNKFVNRAISPELAEQIDNMEVKIKEVFGIPINKIQASKIVSWKSRCYNVDLTGKKLSEILGGKA
jgi:hypothetical protein